MDYNHSGGGRLVSVGVLEVSGEVIGWKGGEFDWVLIGF